MAKVGKKLDFSKECERTTRTDFWRHRRQHTHVLPPFLRPPSVIRCSSLSCDRQPGASRTVSRRFLLPCRLSRSGLRLLHGPARSAVASLRGWELAATELASQPTVAFFFKFVLISTFFSIRLNHSLTYKMARPSINPTFLMPSHGVLKSLLENPLKLPFQHDEGTFFLFQYFNIRTRCLSYNARECVYGGNTYIFRK